MFRLRPWRHPWLLFFSLNLLCPWMWGIFFLVGSSVFLSVVVHQLVVIWCSGRRRWALIPLLLQLDPISSVYEYWLFSHQVVSDSRDSVNCSPPGFSVHGILQARILEWVGISFAVGSSRTRDWAWISCIGRWILYHWATREAQILITYKYKS